MFFFVLVLVLVVAAILVVVVGIVVVVVVIVAVAAVDDVDVVVSIFVSMLFLSFMFCFFFSLFSLACTRALHREKVEKGEWCVPGCQEVRCTLAPLVVVLVRISNQCIQRKPWFSLFFCKLLFDALYLFFL